MTNDLMSVIRIWGVSVICTLGSVKDDTKNRESLDVQYEKQWVQFLRTHC